MLSPGAGIYVNSSEGVYKTAVANNTALRITSHSCYNCRISFYCLSNSTLAQYRPFLWYSYGRIYPNRTENYVTVLESGTGLFVHNQRLYRREGTYTCDIADSNEKIIQLSVGVYDYLSKYLNFKTYTLKL